MAIIDSARVRVGLLSHLMAYNQVKVKDGSACIINPDDAGAPKKSGELLKGEPLKDQQKNP